MAAAGGFAGLLAAETAARRRAGQHERTQRKAAERYQTTIREICTALQCLRDEQILERRGVAFEESTDRDCAIRAFHAAAARGLSVQRAAAAQAESSAQSPLTLSQLPSPHSLLSAAHHLSPPVGGAGSPHQDGPLASLVSAQAAGLSPPQCGECDLSPSARFQRAQRGGSPSLGASLLCGSEDGAERGLSQPTSGQPTSQCESTLIGADAAGSEESADRVAISGAGARVALRPLVPALCPATGRDVAAHTPLPDSPVAAAAAARAPTPPLCSPASAAVALSPLTECFSVSRTPGMSQIAHSPISTLTTVSAHTALLLVSPRRPRSQTGQRRVSLQDVNVNRGLAGRDKSRCAQHSVEAVDSPTYVRDQVKLSLQRDFDAVEVESDEEPPSPQRSYACRPPLAPPRPVRRKLPSANFRPASAISVQITHLTSAVQNMFGEVQAFTPEDAGGSLRRRTTFAAAAGGSMRSKLASMRMEGSSRSRSSYTPPRPLPQPGTLAMCAEVARVRRAHVKRRTPFFQWAVQPTFVVAAVAVTAVAATAPEVGGAYIEAWGDEEEMWF
eukprot:TRINITY_DN13393_c0_g2_i1.p1 TRINITY_DN13393_c0_g2~~TRINITY_DN13393_c0_g2_i1.p1  ORF type:complete len:581 (+),score=110.72 TRINITY_DN13393_c0_g2_i1:65-1744(+)